MKKIKSLKCNLGLNLPYYYWVYFGKQIIFVICYKDTEVGWSPPIIHLLYRSNLEALEGKVQFEAGANARPQKGSNVVMDLVVCKCYN